MRSRPLLCRIKARPKENTLRQGITPHRGAETRIYHRRQ
nr:MAG TPA: hypothetical protein [Caudoviricetes sp.]